VQTACWLFFALMWRFLSFKLSAKLIGAEQGYKPSGEGKKSI